MKHAAQIAVVATVLAVAMAAGVSDVQAQAQTQDQPPAHTSIWGKFKKEVGSIISASGTTGVAGSTFGGTYRRIQDTPLNNIFNSEVAINGDYPHVAITITDWSDRITSRGVNPTTKAQANDCLTFNAALWRNAQSSEPINDLIICAKEAHRGSMRGAFDGGFRFASVAGNHTGQRRTTGPLPPANVYPRTVEADGLLDGPGQLLLANLLMEMGLDVSYGGNVGRVWVVSVGNKPGT